jgi:hypothetical protein
MDRRKWLGGIEREQTRGRRRGMDLQRVTEISTLILTGNRTLQKEQLFYLPFCRKTMFNSKQKIGEIFH